MRGQRGLTSYVVVRDIDVRRVRHILQVHVPYTHKAFKQAVRH